MQKNNLHLKPEKPILLQNITVQKQMYNTEKLTPIFETMGEKSALVVGGGAIGSFICDLLVRTGVKHLAVIDKDFYEIDNIPKSSFVIRYPEDINTSKAEVLAKNLSVRTLTGRTVKGVHIDLKKIGPMALADFDYVILALDNLAMKIFAQKLLKLCPKEKPIVLSCGTNGEFTESMLFAHDGACLRCTVPDEWLLSENPETVHSCAAKINYLLPQKTLPIVSTSGIASLVSAINIVKLVIDHAKKSREFKASERQVETTRSNDKGSHTEIAKLKNCPVCSMAPPSNIVSLSGATNVSTLRQLLTQISFYYDTPFKLKVHILEIPGVPEQIYDQFVIEETCRHCGESFKLHKHSGDIRQTQIVCDKCAQTVDESYNRFENTNAIATRYFSLEETPDDILDTTLLELGYPIGCYYETEPVDSTAITEEICLSCLDVEDGNEAEIADNKYFYLSDDRHFLFDK